LLLIVVVPGDHPVNVWFARVTVLHQVFGLTEVPWSTVNDVPPVPPFALHVTVKVGVGGAVTFSVLDAVITPGFAAFAGAVQLATRLLAEPKVALAVAVAVPKSTECLFFYNLW